MNVQGKREVVEAVVIAALSAAVCGVIEAGLNAAVDVWEKRRKRKEKAMRKGGKGKPKPGKPC